MFKPNVVNVLLCFSIKYLCFFICLAFLENRYNDIVLKNSSNTFDVVINTTYYFSYFLLLLIFFLPIFPALTFLVFKIKSRILFWLSITVIICFEYIYYTKNASATDPMNGIYNAFFTILLLIVFFRKELAKRIYPQSAI
jgi:hypothetical protein